MNKEKTIAVLVDIQERLIPVMDQHENIIKRAEIFTQGLNEIGVPIWVTRQYPKGLGDTIPELKTHLKEDVPVFDKIHYSIWQDEAFQNALKAENPETILLFGVESHICMLQSALDLKNAGYDVHIIYDCTGSRKKSDYDMAIQRLAHAGVIINGVESALFELLQKAGTDTFKAVSKLIK